MLPTTFSASQYPHCFQNTDAFLSEAKGSPSSPPPFSEKASTTGGLKLSPFPSRTDGKKNDAPKAQLNEEEAKAQVDIIFNQLAEFERHVLLQTRREFFSINATCSAPFTIQRLCELCVNRRQHYTSVGKYLRAVEKALLVTSTWDAFPVTSPSASEPTPFGAVGVTFSAPASTAGSAPATPMFSPIPFLHEDARRSMSRSPPPLALEPASAHLGDPPAQTEAEAKGSIAPRSLGLVDELDDPSPGHMSDKPTALSSVTTVPEEDKEEKAVKTEDEGDKSAGEEGKASRPLFSSLKDRFVSSGAKEESDDKMDLDEGHDKENQKT
jgi:serine/threonine-protein phosphatase 4 regulatory subunit 2